jgi:hypothetical protein
VFSFALVTFLPLRRGRWAQTGQDQGTGMRRLPWWFTSVGHKPANSARR